MFRWRVPLLPAAFAWSLGAPAAGASYNLAGQFPARMLATHNAVRAQAGVGPLAWDPALGQAAASYAVQLALTNSFHHSDRHARVGVGENLWMGTRGAYSYDAMVGRWASEGRNFVPGIFPAVSRSGNWENVGHYSQMIWPTTTRVGCALASNSRTDFLVCRYATGGNIDGQRVPSSPRASISEQ
jgi:hypothetical protein